MSFVLLACARLPLTARRVIHATTLLLSPPRPGQYVLACGLRTFAPAFPPLDDSERPGGYVVVVCGEAGETSPGEEEGAAVGATAPGRTAGARGGGGHGGGGGGGGGDGLGRILNTSCLEVCAFYVCSSLTSFSLDGALLVVAWGWVRRGRGRGAWERFLRLDSSAAKQTESAKSAVRTIRRPLKINSYRCWCSTLAD